MKKSIKINALLNMIKQVMQIIFPIVTVPYVARVILPDNYGKINTGSSLISYIALVAGLGIASYAIREGSLVRDNKFKLQEFSEQIFTINIISTVVSYIIFAGILFLIPHYKNLRALLVIQSFSVVFTTLGADWINSIEEDYLYITIRYIILHLISIILMFLYVKTPEDLYVYAAICLITSAGGNLLNIFYIRKYVKLRITLKIEWKKHLLPIFILFGNSIAMTIYVSSDVTMLEIFKGTTAVGIYGVATKIYSVVKQVLNALLIVSIPRMTSYIGEKKMECFIELGKKLMNSLITFMFPLIVGIGVFKSEAIRFAGGSKYQSGENCLLILIIAVAFALLATFYSASVLMPLRKEKYLLIGTVISAIINVVLNFFFIPLFGGDGAALTTLVSEVFVAVYFGYLVKKEGYSFIENKILLLSILGSVLIVGVCIWIKTSLDSQVLYLSLSIIISCFIYFGIQIIGGNPIIKEIVDGMLKFKYKKR